MVKVASLFNFQSKCNEDEAIMRAHLCESRPSLAFGGLLFRNEDSEIKMAK